MFGGEEGGDTFGVVESEFVIVSKNQIYRLTPFFSLFDSLVMEHYGCHVSKPKIIDPESPLTAIAWFLGAPQRWYLKPLKDAEAVKIKQGLIRHPLLRLSDVVIHACYLINLASTDVNILAKSRKRFREELTECNRMGVLNYVLHPGSARDAKRYDRLKQELREGLDEVGGDVCVLVENMTGGNLLCSDLKSCSEVANSHERIKVCIDTAHAWGEGWPDMEHLWDQVLSVVGLNKLGAIHLNDSKVVHGKKKDAHENLFQGHVPREWIKAWIRDSRLRNVPVIMETPRNNHPVVEAVVTAKDDEQAEQRINLLLQKVCVEPAPKPKPKPKPLKKRRVQSKSLSSTVSQATEVDDPREEEKTRKRKKRISASEEASYAERTD